MLAEFSELFVLNVIKKQKHCEGWEGPHLRGGAAQGPGWLTVSHWATYSPSALGKLSDPPGASVPGTCVLPWQSGGVWEEFLGGLFNSALRMAVVGWRKARSPLVCRVMDSFPEGWQQALLCCKRQTLVVFCPNSSLPGIHSVSVSASFKIKIWVFFFYPLVLIPPLFLWAFILAEISSCFPFYVALTRVRRFAGSPFLSQRYRDRKSVV